MPSLLAHHAVQIAAVLMVLAGCAGIAPSVLSLIRGRHGRTMAAGGARVESRDRNEGFLFPGEIAGTGEPPMRGDGPSNGLAAGGRGLGPVAAVRVPVQAPKTQPEDPSPLFDDEEGDAADGILPREEGSAESAAMPGEELQSEEESGIEPEPPAEDNALMALFQYEATKSIVPEALTEAIEPVTIADLVAEARSLRQLLVSARQ